MSRSIALAFFLVGAAAAAFGSTLDVDTGAYVNGAPYIGWWGAAVYTNDQGGTGVGVMMSGNLSLFDSYGSMVDNVPWSSVGGTWSDTYSAPFAWATCYTSAINARAIDQLKLKYGDPACNPVAPGPGGGNVGEILAKCDANNGCAEPLLINLDNGPYRLSGLDDPVSFDINADGHRETIGWTARYASVAFLAIDRNRNGKIDDGSELFGNASPLPNGSRAANGFDALAQYDANGDGVIDSDNPVWEALLLWTDRNHNGISEPDELEPIASSEVSRIYLSHHWTGRRDASGNFFGYQGRVGVSHGLRVCYDAFFATTP